MGATIRRALIALALLGPVGASATPEPDYPALLRRCEADLDKTQRALEGEKAKTRTTTVALNLQVQCPPVPMCPAVPQCDCPGFTQQLLTHAGAAAGGALLGWRLAGSCPTTTIVR